jgi:hypothetical protein
MTSAIDMTRAEWQADAARSVRLSRYAHERIPEGDPVYAWPQEAADLGRDLAERTRSALTARLTETTGRTADAVRARRLTLGREARAGEWGEVAATIRRALNHELVGTDTAALTYALCGLEKLVRDRTGAIHALGEQLTARAIEREIARRATDEAWERELKRREEIRAYLCGSLRITR